MKFYGVIIKKNTLKKLAFFLFCKFHFWNMEVINFLSEWQAVKLTFFAHFYGGIYFKIRFLALTAVNHL